MKVLAETPVLSPPLTPADVDRVHKLLVRMVEPD
jgi:hypothetical protein